MKQEFISMLLFHYRLLWSHSLGNFEEVFSELCSETKGTS